jgi:hypothetical protein
MACYSYLLFFTLPLIWENLMYDLRESKITGCYFYEIYSSLRINAVKVLSPILVTIDEVWIGE